MKNRNYCLCVFLGLTLAFTLMGCKQDISIKGVKKVAIVGANFNIKGSVCNSNTNLAGDLFKGATAVDTNPYTQDTMTQEEKVFIFTLFEGIVNTAKNQLGDSLVLVDSFYKTPVYKSSIEKIDPNRAYIFTPPPYRYIEIMNKQNAEALCKSLKVDAIGVININYENKFFRVPLQLPFTPDKEQISLVISIKVVSRNGEIVHDQNFVIENPKTILDYQNTPLVFNLSDYRGLAYRQAADTFLEEMKTVKIELIN